MNIGLLLEGVRPAPPEQTWLMQQMWVTHTAMESELQLLRQGMEHVFDRVFWAPDGERGEEEERGALEELREGEETLK